jgi:membrane peptidoglycan carboxypeptidase
MVGGRDFIDSQYNRATNTRRPAGTAFVPFVYAAAFTQDFFPGTLVEDSYVSNRLVMIGAPDGVLGEWGTEELNTELQPHRHQQRASPRPRPQLRHREPCHPTRRVPQPRQHPSAAILSRKS